MSIPKRIKRYTGRYTLVDGVPFQMPIEAIKTPAFMAGFFCDYKKAKAMLPGGDLYPLEFLNGKALFMITVVNYLDTTIGKYIEYSLALACTHFRKSALPVLPALFMKAYGTGQFILDLPVSTEISVKGGKGIWGMPKHQASLDFIDGERTVSAQYEKDGQFAVRVEIEKPKRIILPINVGATNYSHFRNMLMASYIYFKSKAGVCIGRSAKGSLYIGDHPRVAHLRELDIESKPFFTLYMPAAYGVLDDYYRSWFVTYDYMPAKVSPEGFESVINLGLSDEWPPAPSITDYQRFKI